MVRRALREYRRRSHDVSDAASFLFIGCLQLDLCLRARRTRSSRLREKKCQASPNVKNSIRAYRKYLKRSFASRVLMSVIGFECSRPADQVVTVPRSVMWPQRNCASFDKPFIVAYAFLDLVFQLNPSRS